MSRRPGGTESWSGVGTKQTRCGGRADPAALRPRGWRGPPRWGGKGPAQRTGLSRWALCRRRTRFHEVSVPGLVRVTEVEQPTPRRNRRPVGLAAEGLPLGL